MWAIDSLGFNKLYEHVCIEILSILASYVLCT
jgi:hypothetical protein